MRRKTFAEELRRIGEARLLDVADLLSCALVFAVVQLVLTSPLRGEVVYFGIFPIEYVFHVGWLGLIIQFFGKSLRPALRARARPSLGARRAGRTAARQPAQATPGALRNGYLRR